MLQSTSKFVRMMAVLMLALSLLGMNALAQSTTDGAIGGTVTDQTGAVIPEATVKATNIGTNKTSTATSDATGRYRVLNLQPGKYTVEITAGNFSPFKAEGIIVEVGRVTTLESKLGVSTQTEAVDVTGEAPVINTQSQDFSTNINQTSINELPINGRRWSQYALLTPGAIPDGNFGLVSFRGISGLLNNNTIDGGDNNNAFYAEERGRTRIGYVISQDAIQEFQVNTSNFSAEYGRAAGAVVNAVTKSGSNSFHGDGFWYYRNEELNAFNPFVTFLGQPVKPTDRRHQFGASVGGPIIKDRVFFFFSWDQQKRDFPGVANAGNPTSFFAPLTAAELTTLSGRVVNATQANAAMAYLTNLTGPVDRRGDQTLFLPKIDWRITDKHSLALTYNRLRWDSPAGIQTAPTVSRGRTSWGNDGVKTDSFNAKLNSLITSRISNEMRFQYGRDFLTGSAQPADPSEVISPLGLPVGTSIGGSAGIIIGTSNYIPRDQNPTETRYQGANSTSMTMGTHLLKFGADVSRVSDRVDSLFNKFGTYTYNNRVDWISDFVNGAAKPCRATVNGVPNTPVPCYTSYAQGFGLQKYEFETTDLNFFVQDDWRVSQRLTVNFGMRYETIFMPQPFLANPLLPQSSDLPNDRNNFGPRFGLAYDITGDGRTVFRGGYGVYYGRFVNSTLSSALTNTGRADGARNFSFVPANAGAPVLPSVLTTAPNTAVSASDVVFYNKDAGAPMIHQWDAVFEKQIGASTAFSASYLGSRGEDLPLYIDRNLPLTTTTKTYTVVGGQYNGTTFPVTVYTGPRPNGNFSRILEVSHTGSSQYDAMVFQLNRRMNKGLQFQMNYTVANSRDNGQTSQTFTPGSPSLLDSNNKSLDEGRSNFDVRSRFIVSAVWQPNYFKGANAAAKALLSDWSLAPIVTLSSGRPYTGFVSGTVSGLCPTGAGTGSLSGINCSGGQNRVSFIPRNSFLEPNTYNVDFRVSRRIRPTEGTSIELLAEAFNLFNHVNVVSVNQTQFAVGGTSAAPTVTPFLTAGVPTFGLPTGSSGTLTKERQLQFAVRFQF